MHFGLNFKALYCIVIASKGKVCIAKFPMYPTLFLELCFEQRKWPKLNISYFLSIKVKIAQDFLDSDAIPQET